MPVAQQPSIIFIVVDDCGYADLGCAGQTGYATSALGLVEPLRAAHRDLPDMGIPGDLPTRPALLRALWESWNAGMPPTGDYEVPSISGLTDMMW